VSKYLSKKAIARPRTRSTRTALRETVRLELRLLTTEIDGVDQRAAARFGLTRTDLRCLDVLAATGPMAPSQLARAVILTSGGLSIALDRLERAGYITRRPDPQDRRKVVVEPTALALELGREVFGTLGARVDKSLRRYGEAELAAIGDFLCSIRLAIQDDAAEAER